MLCCMHAGLKAPMLTSADASESSMAMSEAAGASGASSVSSSAASGIATTTTTTAAVDMIRIELGRDGSMEAAGEATAVADFETGMCVHEHTTMWLQ